MRYKSLIKIPTKTLMPLALVSLVLLAGCKTQEVETHWTAEPVQVDGEMADWAGVPSTYLEDSNVQLGLRNDAENLYILFRFNDPKWARAIRMGGLTLWLDNSGKRKKGFGIRYTGGPFLSEMQEAGMAGQGGFWESLTPGQKERLLQRQAAMANRITIISKEKDQKTAIPADGSRGLAVAFADLQGIYTYEFSIPLKKSDLASYGIDAPPGQTICLGLEWGGMSESDRQRMRQEWGDRRGGGGRGGSMGGPRRQPPDKQNIWVKTQLALPSAE